MVIKAAIMISIEKKMGAPTSWAALRTTADFASLGEAMPRCLAMFSVMTIPASTMTPMERAKPPRDMIFEGTSSKYITRKASRIPTGKIIEMIKLLRICPIKMRMTTTAMIKAIINAFCRVFTALLMRFDRS
ncbi:hypothetical protein ES703_27630 [subsurface metagenome]